MCIGITWTFLPLLAHQRLGLSSSAIGLVVMVNVLAAAIFQTPMGYVADRFGERGLVVAGGTSFVFGAVILAVGIVCFLVGT